MKECDKIDIEIKNKLVDRILIFCKENDSVIQGLCAIAMVLLTLALVFFYIDINLHIE